jgi:hypothetical protein
MEPGLIVKDMTSLIVQSKNIYNLTQMRSHHYSVDIFRLLIEPIFIAVYRFFLT